MDSFTNRLNEALSLRNMKQIELAEKSGLSKSRINHYVNGLYDAKQDAIFLMAKALDVNEAWLMGYDVPIERAISWQDYDLATNGIGFVMEYDDSVKNPHPDDIKTIAAHHDGEEWTKEELEDIEMFKELLRKKRERK